MSQRIMKNFPIEYDGHVYWRSRSVAVVGFTFCKDKNGEWCVLANKRGPGCPDEIGKWCVVCGYLDFDDETGNAGVARETYEETGIKIKPEAFTFDSVNFSKEKDKNVNLRYWTILDGITDNYTLSNAANEKDETTDIKWVKVSEIEKYEWAFGHADTIHEIYEKYVVTLSKGVKYLLELHIMQHTDAVDVSVDTLAICDTREKCKELAQEDINRMAEFNDKIGITHEPYNITDYDVVVKWDNGEAQWYYWYFFKAIPYHD